MPRKDAQCNTHQPPLKTAIFGRMALQQHFLYLTENPSKVSHLCHSEFCPTDDYIDKIWDTFKLSGNKKI